MHHLTTKDHPMPGSRRPLSARRSPSLTCRPRLEALEAREVPAASFVDQSFGTVGIVTQNFGTSGARNDGAEAVVVQPDGKTVVAGFAQRGTTDFDFLVARFNRDGTPDTSFDADGSRFVAFDLGGTFDDRARAVVLQSDGKILVAGFATRTTGTDLAVCRLNTNGSLDTTFDTDGRQTVAFDLGGTLIDVANDLVVQADGKILLAGSATVSGTDTNFAVCRLNANGSLDDGTAADSTPGDSFSTAGKQTVAFDLGGNDNDQAEGIALAPGGAIVLAGTAQFNSTLSEVAVARLTSTGALDSTFGTAGLTTLRYANFLGRNTGKDVGVQADGKIVVAGVADRGNADTDFGVARLTTAGFLDTTFDGDGRLAQGLSATGNRNDQPEALLLQPDGKIVVAGFSNVDIGAGVNNDVFILRLLPNGQNDPLYNGNGRRFYDLTVSGIREDEARAVALGVDGIVVAGFRDTATADGTDVTLLRVVRDDWVIVAPDAGGPPTVRIFTPTGTLLYQFNAFAPAFKGGVRVAAADVNGDTVPDILCAPAKGGPRVIQVFDGFTLQLDHSVTVYPSTFTPSFNFVLGDVLGDNAPELIVAPEGGAQPIVKIFDPVTGALIKSIRVFGTTATHGVRLVTGNTDLAGKRELIVSQGVGGQPLVRVFNAETGALVQQIQVFAPTFTAGVFVAAGNVNSDGREDLIVSAGGGAPVVKVFSVVVPGSPTLLKAHRPFPNSFTTGVRIAAFPLADGGTKVIAAPGPGLAPHVKLFDADTGAVLSSFLAFPASLKKGLFVTGVNR
jgi:uncharacterized delta-60 repeat protein